MVNDLKALFCLLLEGKNTGIYTQRRNPKVPLFKSHLHGGEYVFKWYFSFFLFTGANVL